MLEQQTTDRPTNVLKEEYLTIEDCISEIYAMGFRDVRLRQIQRWANEKKLPFFRFGKRMYIDKNQLRESFRKLQRGAVKETEISKRPH